MSIASGASLDALAWSVAGITRREIPGRWWSRVWRWVWRIPTPLESDDEFRKRAIWKITSRDSVEMTVPSWAGEE